MVALAQMGHNWLLWKKFSHLQGEEARVSGENGNFWCFYSEEQNEPGAGTIW